MGYFSIVYETFIEDVEAAANAQIPILSTDQETNIATQYLTFDQVSV